MSSDTTKQFAVNWDNHMKHVKKAFDSLLNNRELTDVTLYAEGRKVGAHKMLLSACSSYFRNLFREFPQDHPIVVLKGVSYSVLADILKFIYNGEVSVDSEVFDSFLQAAEFLQISGLTDGEKSSKNIENDDKEIVPSGVSEEESENCTENKIPKKQKRENSDVEYGTQSKRNKEVNSVVEYSAIKCEPEVLTAIFSEELSKQFQEDPHFTPDLLLQTAGPNNYSIDENSIKIEDVSSYDTAEEQLCEKISTSGSIRTKYKFSENQLKCPICYKEFSHPYSLHHHKPVHSGGTQCPICHAVLSRKYNLKMHMKTRHNVM